MNTKHTSGGLTRCRFGGFTLAEAMMATVVLAIAAAGVLLPFASGARVRAEGMRRTLAANLANDLMEEIIRTDFGQIMNKYGAHTEQQGHIISNFDTGQEYSDPIYANFSRNAICEYVSVPQQPELEQDQCNFIRVTVRVKYSGRDIAVINRLIAK